MHFKNCALTALQISKLSLFIYSWMWTVLNLNNLVYLYQLLIVTMSGEQNNNLRMINYWLSIVHPLVWIVSVQNLNVLYTLRFAQKHQTHLINKLWQNQLVLFCFCVHEFKVLWSMKLLSKMFVHSITGYRFLIFFCQDIDSIYKIVFWIEKFKSVIVTAFRHNCVPNGKKNKNFTVTRLTKIAKIHGINNCWEISLQVWKLFLLISTETWDTHLWYKMFPMTPKSVPWHELWGFAPKHLASHLIDKCGQNNWYYVIVVTMLMGFKYCILQMSRKFMKDILKCFEVGFKSQ